MDLNKNNITTGKPKVSGCIYRAPKGATLPTDATSDLDSAFKSLGYITEDGVNIDNAASKNMIKAWGGDVVITTDGDKGYQAGFSLMEHLNTEVQKVVYGDDNVTEGKINATGEVGDTAAYVIERVTKNGKADRIVIPEADVASIGSVSFKDADAVVYPVTLAMLATIVEGVATYFQEYFEQ